jgi:hypothetical protein
MALDPRLLDFFVSERGPYLYHGGDAASQEAILAEGLKPQAETGQRSVFKGRPEFRSRPGHVYLGSLSHLERLPLTPLVRVDLRELDPERLCCDEDALWELGSIKADWPCLDAISGNSYPTGLLVESMGRWFDAGASFGDWADVHAALIDRSEVVCLSLAYGAVAYEGAVPTQALSPL